MNPIHHSFVSNFLISVCPIASHVSASSSSDGRCIWQHSHFVECLVDRRKLVQSNCGCLRCTQDSSLSDSGEHSNVLNIPRRKCNQSVRAQLWFGGSRMAHVVCERSMHNTVVMGVEGVRRCARGLAQCSIETLQYSRRIAYRTGTGRQTARQQSAARKSNRVPPSITTTLSRVWCERAATYVCFLSLRIVSLKNQRHAKLIWCATYHLARGFGGVSGKRPYRARLGRHGVRAHVRAPGGPRNRNVSMRTMPVPRSQESGKSELGIMCGVELELV